MAMLLPHLKQAITALKDKKLKGLNIAGLRDSLATLVGDMPIASTGYTAGELQGILYNQTSCHRYVRILFHAFLLYRVVAHYVIVCRRAPRTYKAEW